ncbi:cytochrome P450 4V2-like isoform X2 [Watersipora subatra]|uniref:cytochrome P450 4V2-like isoform X2 n=1 Tax=Watersipora subatra TaxID=2589382 RepID=UPI00355B3967
MRVSWCVGKQDNMEAVLFHFTAPSFTSLLSAVAISLSFYQLFAYLRQRNRVKHLSAMPSLLDWPLIGAMPAVEREPTEFFNQMTSLCDKFRKEEAFFLRLGNEYNIQIYTARQVEKLLRSYDFLDKSHRYQFLHKWLNFGLLTSSGKKWKSRRKILTPSFHFNILKDALNTMNSHATTFRDLLMEEVFESSKVVDIFPLLTLLSLDIIGETAMGVQMDALHSKESEYVKSVLYTKDAIARRSRTPWLFPNVIFENSPSGRRTSRCINFMHQYAHKVIRERRAAMSGSATETLRNQAFLDTLLDCRDENGDLLSDEDIREEVDTFMFEGHDTVSSALGITTYLLGLHLEEQEKCYQQLLDIVGTPRTLTMNDLSQMTYLEWCIKESMRIYPPVPFVARDTAADIEIAGHKIPKGAGAIAVVISGLHRDPSVFPEPTKFDPHRFSPEESANRHPYAYIPFSAGPRNCIGQKFAMMELKVILAKMLTTFNIESVVKQADLRVQAALVLQPCDGIKIKLTSRN